MKQKHAEEACWVLMRSAASTLLRHTSGGGGGGRLANLAFVVAKFPNALADDVYPVQSLAHHLQARSDVMQRPPRFIRPNTVYEVTVRTVQGRLLLRPCPATNDAILGVLGRAQALLRMKIHAVVVMSNHMHLLVSPDDARQLSRFMCHVNSNIAREVGRLVGWKEKFWGRRYQAIAVTDEPAAQIGRLRYLLENGVKEGLVSHPGEWPGVHSARALAEGLKLAGTWFDRAGYWRAEQARKKNDSPVMAGDFKEVYRLELSPLPCLVESSPANQQVFVRELIAEVVSEAEARGGSVLGTDAICRQHPHSTPNVHCSPAPLVHAASREFRLKYRQAFGEFVAAYRDAAVRQKFGLAAQFPEGSFPAPRPFVEGVAA